MTAIDQSGLYDLKERLLQSPNVECLEFGIQLLEEYCAQANEIELHTASEGTQMLRQLLELAMSCQYDSADEDMWRPMTEFSAEHCETLGALFEKAANGEDLAEINDSVHQFCQKCNHDWGEYLQLLQEFDEPSSEQWDESDELDDDSTDDPELTNQIDQLLSVLSQTNKEQVGRRRRRNTFARLVARRRNR